MEDWAYHARKVLIDSALDEIDLTKDPQDVYLSVFYELAKLGLHMKAKKLGLLEREVWQSRENHKELMTSLTAFLWEQVK